MIFWIAILTSHFICDYWLQTTSLWDGKRQERNWLYPLLIHSGINALGAGAVVGAVTLSIGCGLAAFGINLVAHAIIDRLKIPLEQALSDFKFGRLTATAIDQSLHLLTF